MDGLDRWHSGPVPRIRGQSGFGGGHSRQDVGPSPHEPTRREDGPIRIDCRRHDGERWARDNRRKIRRRVREVDDDLIGADHGQADRRFGPASFTVGASPDHIVEKRGQLARARGREHSHPARDHVGCLNRRAVREEQSRAELEDEFLPVARSLPAIGQGRLDVPGGVDRGQRFEELGHDLSAAGVGLNGRIQGGRTRTEYGDRPG